MTAQQAFKLTKAISMLIDIKIQEAIDRITPTEELGIYVGQQTTSSEIEELLTYLLSEED